MMTNGDEKALIYSGLGSGTHLTSTDILILEMPELTISVNTARVLLEEVTNYSLTITQLNSVVLNYLEGMVLTILHHDHNHDEILVTLEELMQDMYLTISLKPVTEAIRLRFNQLTEYTVLVISKHSSKYGFLNIHRDTKLPILNTPVPIGDVSLTSTVTTSLLRIDIPKQCITFGNTITNLTEHEHD